MKALDSFRDLTEHVGGLRAGMLVLVAGELSLSFHTAFIEAVLGTCPNALIVGNDFGGTAAALRKLKSLAKRERRLCVVIHSLGAPIPGLSALRSGVGDSDPDLILLVKGQRPPYEINVAKNRGGHFGTVVVLE